MEWKASIAKRTRSLRFMGLLRQRAHCSDPALAQMQVREGLRDTPPLFPAATVAVAGIRKASPLPPLSVLTHQMDLLLWRPLSAVAGGSVGEHERAPTARAPRPASDDGLSACLRRGARAGLR